MSADHPSYRQPAPPTGWRAIAPFVLFALAVAALAYLVGGSMRPRSLYDPNAKPREVTPRTGPDSEERETIALFKGSKESVVNVDTLQRREVGFNTLERQTGTGSGFVWDADGHIVTNFHVVKEVVEGRDPNLAVRVIMADRTSYSAMFVGGAPDHDLAVLRISAPKDRLKPIPLGSSSDLEVGQNVYAIGNPFGLSLSLTKGIISALDREIQSEPGKPPITGVIQTDAAINPGNSGGPLLDKDGRLIGVNTAIYSPSGTNAGIGFAIPSDTVNQVVPELIRRGRVPRPYLGVKIVGWQVANELGVRTGALIESVIPGGAAAAAGVRPTTREPDGSLVLGDIILAVDGGQLKQPRDLLGLLSRHRSGETVTLTVLRGASLVEREDPRTGGRMTSVEGGERVDVKVTLQGI